MQLSYQRVSHHLCPEAEITGADILPYILEHLGPPIVVGYQFQHFPMTGVAGDLGVMTQSNDLSVQV